MGRTKHSKQDISQSLLTVDCTEESGDLKEPVKPPVISFVDLILLLAICLFMVGAVMVYRLHPPKELKKGEVESRTIRVKDLVGTVPLRISGTRTLQRLSNSDTDYIDIEPTAQASVEREFIPDKNRPIEEGKTSLTPSITIRNRVSDSELERVRDIDPDLVNKKVTPPPAQVLDKEPSLHDQGDAVIYKIE